MREKILELLNKALADEWLAYYQYWIGARIVKGELKEKVIEELEEHAGDELRHAGMLVDRILELGGTPILKPEDWYKMTNCGYDAPERPDVKPILEQNIKGEQCAIRVYKNLIESTQNEDQKTYDMTKEILADEEEHEEDLKSLLEKII